MGFAKKGEVLVTGSTPSPENQIRFLRNIQRILSEGSTVSTYKFALLQTLADLAVRKGDDSGSPLILDMNDIAENVIELYWRQCLPFKLSDASSELVLRQNTKGQPKIIKRILESQAAHGTSLYRVKNRTGRVWTGIVRAVSIKIGEMPLPRLQTIGAEKLSFLYDEPNGTTVTLNPGVAYCFRAFYELILNLIRGEWVRYVQKVNALELGHTKDLASFLFGDERSSLNVYRPLLHKVQDAICLYCRKSISGDGDVDHFVPWSRFPVDLGHNLVLAHKVCNNAKCDHVAAEEHLAAWIERNHRHKAVFHDWLREKALPCDGSAAIQIAKWVYQQTEKANGQVWVEKKTLKHLDHGWQDNFLTPDGCTDMSVKQE
jgi:5-methylcytosine-specific restriction endonuclease McrA